MGKETKMNSMQIRIGSSRANVKGPLTASGDARVLELRGVDGKGRQVVVQIDAQEALRAFQTRVVQARDARGR